MSSSLAPLALESPFYSDISKKNFKGLPKRLSLKKLVVTATTGLAAMLIDGCTLHSWARIGRGEDGIRELLIRIMGFARYNAARGSLTSPSLLEGDPPDSMKRWLDCQMLIVDESAFAVHFLSIA